MNDLELIRAISLLSVLVLFLFCIMIYRSLHSRNVAFMLIPVFVWSIHAIVFYTAILINEGTPFRLWPSVLFLHSTWTFLTYITALQINQHGKQHESG